MRSKIGRATAEKLTKDIMKRRVAAFVRSEINISERMCHFMEAYILAIAVVGIFARKVVPGQVDSVLADMAFIWRCGLTP